MARSINEGSRYDERRRRMLEEAWVDEAITLSEGELLAVLPPGRFTFAQAAHCWRLVGNQHSTYAVDLRLQVMVLKGVLTHSDHHYSRPAPAVVVEAAPALRWLSTVPTAPHKKWVPVVKVKDPYCSTAPKRSYTRKGCVCWSNEKQKWRVYVYMGNRKNKTLGMFHLRSTAEMAAAEGFERMQAGLKPRPGAEIVADHMKMLAESLGW